MLAEEETQIITSQKPKLNEKSTVIIPPPEIKQMVERAAHYVAKNGADFESMIMKVEQGNPKFNFLKYPDDPYRPYYLQKVSEYSGEVNN